MLVSGSIVDTDSTLLYNKSHSSKRDSLAITSQSLTNHDSDGNIGLPNQSQTVCASESPVVLESRQVYVAGPQ